jgi:hypothetical protein
LFLQAEVAQAAVLHSSHLAVLVNLVEGAADAFSMYTSTPKAARQQ